MGCRRRGKIGKVKKKSQTRYSVRKAKNKIKAALAEKTVPDGLLGRNLGDSEPHSK